MRFLALVAALITPLPDLSCAQEIYQVRPVTLSEWKAVFGRVEARDRIPARARLGGTLQDLAVTEGDTVSASQLLARIKDEKLGFQLAALDAELGAVASQLENAQTELLRGEDLLKRGVTTVQRLDLLRTQVSVLANEKNAIRSKRQVIEQQANEGEVLAPVAGLVLNVPLAAGAVVMPGELVAMIGGGGFFLRLAVPESHAAFLTEGDNIIIGQGDTTRQGRLARVYPQIENGRVIADVDVPDLSHEFVDARVLVRLPVGERRALVLPQSALITRAGLDFVEVSRGDDVILRTVLQGQSHNIDGIVMVEIVTGVQAGEQVVIQND
ncbi:MAG: efflux RND transporter periplasmic adaptor subunit [Rhodobacteraceae bacterium]|nr:efflux RND transporter periplasmic adaptor subunit [Paracoccaceae bacterium]